MAKRPLHRRRRATIAFLSAGLFGSVLSPAVAASAGRDMNLTFDGASLRTNSGSSALVVREVTKNGGGLKTVTGRSGRAIRTPAYRSGAGAPRAVVTAVQRNNDLSPGTGSFSFGADFTLDSTSQGSRYDNGNNLIQRGLFDAPMQYKVQLDRNKPACRVKGSRGAVSVVSTRSVQPDRWYRVVCSRSGTTVTLKVVRLDDGRKWTYRRSGRTGSLDAPASLPLSVGGKVDASGRILASSDQFNGRIDNAFFDRT